MRYNPDTDRPRYTIDEIAEQCRQAILKASKPEPQKIQVGHKEFAQSVW